MKFNWTVEYQKKTFSHTCFFWTTEMKFTFFLTCIRCFETNLLLIYNVKTLASIRSPWAPGISQSTYAVWKIIAWKSRNIAQGKAKFYISSWDHLWVLFFCIAWASWLKNFIVWAGVHAQNHLIPTKQSTSLQIMIGHSSVVLFSMVLGFFNLVVLRFQIRHHTTAMITCI